MNILIFKGIFQYDVVNHFVEDIEENLTNKGHRVIEYNLANETFDDFEDII